MGFFTYMLKGDGRGRGVIFFYKFIMGGLVGSIHFQNKRHS
jgi:hypothetical protein